VDLARNWDFELRNYAFILTLIVEPNARKNKKHELCSTYAITHLSSIQCTSQKFIFDTSILHNKKIVFREKTVYIRNP